MRNDREEIRRAIGELDEVAELLAAAGERLWGVLGSAARDVQLFNGEEASLVAEALADYRDAHRSVDTRSADLADAIRLRVCARHPEARVA